MTGTEMIALKVKLGQAFTPGAPIDHQELFSGRIDQINDVLNATLQVGSHAVLFGERGVGKTSLARVISTVVAAVGHKQLNCGTINCDSSDDFSTLWRKVFRELSMAITLKKSAGFTPEDAVKDVALESILPDRELTPDDIRFVLTRLNIPSIVVIDELDRLTNQLARLHLADTIKNLSDHAVPTTIVLVGVADAIEDLISQHESIARALIQVPMPRMSVDELMQILDKGFESAGLTVLPEARDWIARLSQGLPHYTHSLGLYSGFHAVERDRVEVRVDDVLAATKTTVEKSHRIRSLYYTATMSPQKQNRYSEVLRAAALAPTDELGYFPAAALKGPLSQMMGKPYDVPNYSRHLHDFCDERHGPVLKKRGEKRRVRFRFVDPMMQPFVIIHDYSTGRLTNALLRTHGGRLGEVLEDDGDD